MDKLSKFGDLKGIPFTISPNWLHEEISGLTKIERLVLGNLCRRASGQDKTSFPSTGRIALDTDSTKPSVIKAVKSLIEKGCLTKEERFGEDGKQMSNLYSVNFQWEPPSVVVNKPKSQRGSYKRDKGENDEGKMSLPCKLSLPSPVNCLNPPCKMSLPEVIPSVSNTQSLSKTTTVPQKPSEEQPIPDDLKDFVKFHQDKKFLDNFKQLLDQWGKTYPSIDILQEIRKAHNWLLENPDEKRTRIGTYLGKWMRNAQKFVERKGSVGGQQNFFGADRQNNRVLKNVDPGFIKGLTDKFGND